MRPADFLAVEDGGKGFDIAIFQEPADALAHARRVFMHEGGDLGGVHATILLEDLQDAEVGVVKVAVDHRVGYATYI